MLNNIEQTGEYIWKFVHGLQTTNFKNRPISDVEATAIHGYCRPFTDEDYSRNREIIFNGKKVHKIKFTHNSIYKSTYIPY